MTDAPEQAASRRRPRIAVIPGDGVGPEVIACGRLVLDEALAAIGADGAEWLDLDWGTDHYHRTGAMMPGDGLDVLRGCDAVYFGAVGDPAVPDDVTLWGLLLPIRRGLDLYANLRPAMSLPVLRHGQALPVRDFDILFVRENTEGEYSGVGHQVPVEGPPDAVVESAVFTRAGIERIARAAFDQARGRRRHLTSVSKANALRHSGVLWNDVVAEVAADFPDVELQMMLVDAAAYEIALRPEAFDVVLASNLFGDILSDLGAALQGSLGLAASANVAPGVAHTALFEPVHGSAPALAGRNVANPVAAMWSAALMAAHLGHPAAERVITAAVKAALASGVATADIGGTSTTIEMSDAVRAHIQATADRAGDREA